MKKNVPLNPEGLDGIDAMHQARYGKTSDENIGKFVMLCHYTKARVRTFGKNRRDSDTMFSEIGEQVCKVVVEGDCQFLQSIKDHGQVNADGPMKSHPTMLAEILLLETLNQRLTNTEIVDAFKSRGIQVDERQVRAARKELGISQPPGRPKRNPRKKGTSTAKRPPVLRKHS